MKEREPQVLDLEKIIRSRAGSKAKYIPQFLINWFKKIAHQDYINGYLKEGYVGVDFCENCLGYLGVEIEVKGLENLPDDGRVYTMNFSGYEISFSVEEKTAKILEIK